MKLRLERRFQKTPGLRTSLKFLLFLFFKNGITFRAIFVCAY